MLIPLITTIAALVLPFLAYVGLDAAGLDISPYAYVVLVIAFLVTALAMLLETLLALRSPKLPNKPPGPLPPATAIIAAYLPNEAPFIVETVHAFLRLTYPDLQIILAYNTPESMSFEDELRRIADLDGRFEPLRVHESTSKADNVNVALALARGEFVGVFDADHHPDPGSFERAWRWLGNGWDAVQGHCLVRNGEESWLARMIAIEFEAIYAVNHPGHAGLHDFAIFGGSNGYWKIATLRKTGMDRSMLTEDIDATARAIDKGANIAVDRRLISSETAPADLRALWNQRMRWSQGWFQVARDHLGRILASPHVTLRQKLGFVWLLGWCQLYPWLAFQIFPVIAFWLWQGRPMEWFIPIFVVTTVVTLGSGPLQLAAIHHVADDSIREQRRFVQFPLRRRRRLKFWIAYLLILFPYAEFKHVIVRSAQVKDLTGGDAEWKITPRSRRVDPEEEEVGHG